jgi:hypothetical protein
MGPAEAVPTFVVLRICLMVVATFRQEAKHRAITLDDVKEVMTAINRKHLVEQGSWAYGNSATPSRRTIARYFSFAAEEMNKDWDSAERRLFKEYNERVFYPFVRTVRQVDYNRDPTTPVPDWLKCVAWCDGGIPQLQAIINDDLQGKDKSLKIDRNKHAA